MTNKDAPAFPIHHNGLESGLTKREYAAIHAMQGILASNATLTIGDRTHDKNDNQWIADTALALADALLAGGEK